MIQVKYQEFWKPNPGCCETFCISELFPWYFSFINFGNTWIENGRQGHARSTVTADIPKTRPSFWFCFFVTFHVSQRFARYFSYISFLENHVISKRSFRAVLRKRPWQVLEVQPQVFGTVALQLFTYLNPLTRYFSFINLLSHAFSKGR